MGAATLDVTFTRTDRRRYAIRVKRAGFPDLVMNPAPGYHPLVPHDLVHLIVEDELGIRHGIFGQVAAGGDAGTFRRSESRPPDRRQARRERRRAARRGRQLARKGRDEAAWSERATLLCVSEWLTRSSQPERRRAAADLADLAAHTRASAPPDEIRALCPAVLARIRRRLDESSARWSALAVGQSMSCRWSPVTRPSRRRGNLAAACALAMALLVPAPPGARAAEPATGSDLAARLQSDTRPAADRARDPGRKPAEVVAFLGIEPGMTVLDVIAAGGYYTEVLSVAVGPEGTVYAQNNAFVLQMRDGANDRALTERLRDGRLANVRRLDREMDALGLEPGSVDAAITALNFHDVYNGSGPDAAAAFLGRIYTVLAPGGVLGLIDHAGGAAGVDDAKLHRIDESRALASARQAGFVVEATSDVLRNPDDDRTRGVFAPGLRGHTDRFLLRLRKPDPAAD